MICLILFCVCWYILGIVGIIKLLLTIDDVRIKDLILVFLGGFLGGFIWLDLLRMSDIDVFNKVIIKRK